jgi:hypothetical protein
MTDQGHCAGWFCSRARAGNSGHEVKAIGLGLTPGEGLNFHGEAQCAQLV